MNLPQHLQILKNQSPDVFSGIYEHNEYSLVAAEIQGRTVFDVGANIGVFSIRCIELGAKEVFAIEAQPTIFSNQLLPNVRAFPQIRAINLAISETDNQTVYIPNQSANSKLGNAGEPVKTVCLKTVSAGATDAVLKLDCEGSEFNVLLNADKETMARFCIIHIEIHGSMNSNPQYQGVGLVRNKLIEFGFRQLEPVYQMQAIDGKTSQTIPMDVFIEKWVRA